MPNPKKSGTVCPECHGLDGNHDLKCKSLSLEGKDDKYTNPDPQVAKKKPKE
jgi:hypothetical protein